MRGKEGTDDLPEVRELNRLSCLMFASHKGPGRIRRCRRIMLEKPPFVLWAEGWVGERYFGVMFDPWEERFSFRWGWVSEGCIGVVIEDIICHVLREGAIREANGKRLGGGVKR